MNKHLRLLLPLCFLFPSCNQTQLKTNNTAQKPNVIFIISDDQAYTDYGFMGHPHIKTPHIDQLAQESASFTRGYVTTPLCGPSLASIITGKYAFQHLQTGNDPSKTTNTTEKTQSPEDKKKLRHERFDIVKERVYQHKLLTEYLHESGYKSFQSGKWWLGSWEEGHFDAGMTHGDYLQGGRHGDEGLTIGREGLDPIYQFIDHAQANEDPFFIWYAPFLPHTPHNPPDELLQKYINVAPNKSVAEYWAMCEWFDQTVGQLLAHIKAKNLDENTLVVFTCDNGWIQSDVHNRYAPRSKRAPHEGGIRTPILLKWPGTIDPGFNHNNLVSNIDLAPTVLDAIGDVEHNLPGISLLDTEAINSRKTIYVDSYNHDILNMDKPTETVLYQVAVEKKWKLMVPNTAMIQKEYTSTQDHRQGYYSNNAQLFDLDNDPQELTNLAETNPKIVERLSQQINDWWRPAD